MREKHSRRSRGRPNGHFPKDRVIRMLVKTIKALTEKKRAINEQLKTEKKSLNVYRKSIVPKRRRATKKVIRRGRAKVTKTAKKFDSFRIVKVRKPKRVTKKAPAKKKQKEVLPL